MRTASIAVLSASLLCGRAFAADKLTFDERVELMRGLVAEYAKAKVLIPRAKKPLEFDSKGTYDKKAWADVAKDSGPAARVGDLIQITKVDFGSDKIVLDLNGGFKGGRHWYDGVQIGMGAGNNPTPVAIGNNDSNAPGGTVLEILFHKPLQPMKASEVKKMLAAVLDFDAHSATEIYSETLAPETQKAIRDKHIVVGMTREQVIMALGKTGNRSRETKDGLDLEDWVYGTPPGKITFVTFNGDKVIKVKEAYAGPITEASGPPIIH